MTEEIIIDGVNVAGCAYFRESRCFDCGTQAICCQHPNCYYKQLKRLEQENKTLKANASVIQEYITKNEQLKTNIDSLVKINERLKQENKELKEEKLYRGIDKQFIEDANDKLYWENKKYRSALEEIRENLVKLKTNDEDDFTYEYSKIEDKINEVLGND